MFHISLDNGVVTKQLKVVKSILAFSRLRKAVEMGWNSVHFRIVPFKVSFAVLHVSKTVHRTIISHDVSCSEDT